MDSSNRLASFLNSINIDSTVEKEIKEFSQLTAVAYFQKLEYQSLEDKENKYIVALLVCCNDSYNRHVIYDGLNIEKAQEEYQKLVNLLHSQTEDFFLGFNKVD